MATEVRLPSRIGRRYRVERALGEGGMARVYAALDEQSGALVALKQLTSEVIEKAQGAALLFEREFHTLRQLRHPHIVEAYDYGVEDGRPFYTMELLEGSDLRELAPCDWRLACRLMREVATALALLHSRRLIHRDLSPRNLWRTPDGAVKLIDFGAMGTHGSLSLQLIGTPPFTAPEVYHRQTIDPRTDLYALGAIGYWLLTGAHAYPASRLRNLPEAWKRPPPSVGAIAGGVPEGLVQLIRSLLSLEMVARPRCAAEVIERLDVLLGEPQAQGPAVAEGYLITPSLVGRSRELAELQAHIDGLSQGRSGVVVIECAAGQGRSRLLQEASLAARLAGATVLDVGAAAQPHRAYGVARGLVAALARAMPESDRAALPADVRELVRAGGAETVIPDPREHRSRLLDALRLAVLAAAERGPLAVILDDAELADEASLAVLAALASDSGERAVLLIVGVLANTEPSAPLTKLRSRASVLHPAPLPEPAIRELLGSIFGDVPHVARLSVLVEQRTRGNVVMIMELLRGFVGSGAIRYADGSWVIPREVQSLGEAVRLRDAFAGQVATLEGDTLELAAIWAICGEELSLERVKRAFCAGAAHTPRELFHALDELVYAEILVGAAGAYAFRQEGLRLALVDSLSDERRAELHARVGSAMIAEGALAPAEQLAAAWHLMRAGVERTRGARLVAEALADPRPTAERAEGTVEAVAEALGVLQESGAHQVLRMRLSLSLMRCAYYYDARLADAAMPALDELAEASGLAAARAMPAEVPAAERLERGIAEATARWEARDLEARGLHPATALLELSQTAFAALGVLILQFDIPAIARLRELLTPLEAVDRDNAMSVSHELVDLVYDAMRGRERVATERRLALIERLYDPSLLQGVPEFARKHLIATQLHAQGMAEVSTRQQLALSRADAIEALELQMYQGAALQIRFMVELYRGRAEQAAIYRDRIDLASMQEGSGRQTEMWLVRYLALPYAAWGDVLALRQTVQQLEELTVLHAGYSPFLSIARGALQLERGQHAEAVASLERALDLASAGEHGAWLQAMVIYVPALVRAGEHARAIEVARAIWSGPPAGVDLDRLRRVLAPSLALARAALGEVAEARDELDGLVEQARAEGETDLSLARLYEYRAQVAELDADEALFDASVREMGVHARSCGNPSLISRHELLSTRIEDADGERDLAAEETAAATRVRGRSDRDEISAERTERSGRGRAGAE